MALPPVTIGIVTFTKPDYVISGLGDDVWIELNVVKVGSSEWVSLETTKFTEINGLCGVLRVRRRLLPPGKWAYFAPTARVTIPEDAWAIIQPTPGVEGFTLSGTDAGKPIKVDFFPVPPPNDLVDPLASSAPPETSPDAKVLINGGTISNGVENSVLYFYYTLKGVQDVLRSDAIDFGKASLVLNNATISSFEIHNPPKSGPEFLATSETVTLEPGMSAVVMSKPLVPPSGTPKAILGIEYYLAEMVKEGPVGTTTLFGVL
jgi:hypothetical protein